MSFPRFIRPVLRFGLAAIALSAAIPLWAPPLQAVETQTNRLNFLVFGDWGRQGSKEQREVAGQMGVAAQAIDARFVISVGDNFYERGVASVNDPQWQTSFEQVYTAPSLQVPWHVVLGNHDYKGNSSAEIEYSKKSKRWHMPARYYQISEKIDGQTAVDFFFLDTTPMAEPGHKKDPAHAEVEKQDVAGQLAWLEAALKNSTAPWKIVIGHHTIYSGGEHGDTPYLIRHIEPLLEKYGVQAYFNGHDHDLEHLKAGKVNLFCCGAGAQGRKATATGHTQFVQGNSLGFATVELSAGEMTVRMIDSRGKVLYSTTVPR